MLTISQLYCGWSILWITYFIAAFLLPITRSKIRPSAKITADTIITQTVWNALATGVTVPLVYYIPQIIYFPSTYVGYIMKWIVMLMMSEAWVYYIHRLLHHKWFYHWHTAHHHFIQPNSITGLYKSILEVIILDELSLLVPSQFVGFSLPELILFSIIYALVVVKGHGGFQLHANTSKWLPNWIISSEEHDVHHEFLTANFGVFYILDYLHGTYRSPTPKKGPLRTRPPKVQY